MRTILLFAAAGLSACASSGLAPAPTRPVETVRVAGAGTGAINVRAAETEVARPKTLAMNVDRVWSALPAVYESLGIPVAELNQGSRTIGNPGLRVRGRLGDTRLSRYLDCGAAQGGPNAETYNVTLSVLTSVQAQGEAATAVLTDVQASARPVSLAGEPVRCSTKGALENRIADALRAMPQG
jgi:hypothetical protein